MFIKKTLTTLAQAGFSAIKWRAAPIRNLFFTLSGMNDSVCDYWSKKSREHTKTLRQVLESCPRQEKSLKVTVLGAGGAVGEPLSMMLKQSPLIDELALYDICNISGMGLDISHMDTRCKVCTFVGEDELQSALENSRVVVMLAGVPYRNGENLEQHFCQNANIAKELSTECQKVCPEALLAVVTSPINSIVPIVTEIFQPNDHRVRVFGVMGAEVLNANTFAAESTGINPEDINVPVIGGSSSETAVPVFSMTRPRVKISLEEIERLVEKVQQNSGDTAMQKESPYNNHLSMAFATARFAISLCKGIVGQQCVVDTAYVRSKVMDDCPYMSTMIELGPYGVMRNWGMPKMIEYEQSVFERALTALRNDIHRAIVFLHGDRSKVPDISSLAQPCRVSHMRRQLPPR